MAQFMKEFRRVGRQVLARFQTKGLGGKAEGSKATRRRLMASRPGHLPQDYQLCRNQDVATDMFSRMRRSLFRALDERMEGADAAVTTVFREHGQTRGKYPYFYLKPAWDKGWLFEQSETGWVVVRAEKIVGEDLFLRRQEAWDAVDLFTVNGEPGGLPRLQSRVLGKELLSPPVYEHKLLRSILDSAQ